MINIIHSLYLDLLKKHGHPQELWPEWCTPVKSLTVREMNAIGAILGQRTSWRNADIALKNLKTANLLSLSKLAKLSPIDLIDHIRAAGFYQTKPRRLIAFSDFVHSKGGLTSLLKENHQNLRTELLNVYGIGPETADTILLFALDKPSFIIDDYTKKILKREQITTEENYLKLKALFEENLPKSVEIYQNFHALIIIDQKGRDNSKMAPLLTLNH